MWWWQDTIRAADGAVVEVGFTDTQDGCSDGPLRSLNLGGKVGDDPDRVARNRAAVAAAAGVPGDRLVFMQQTHSTRVVTYRAGSTDPIDADGVVTTERGIALAALVADCTPILLADPSAGVIGAVHAGRPGMVGGIVDNAVDAMAQLGAANPVAIVGPSVCGRCYEVPLEMREQAAAVAPASRAVSWTGTPAIDVAGGVVAQLAARDVPVTWVPGCTRESERLFSYRRDHAAGRFAGVVVLRGSGT